MQIEQHGGHIGFVCAPPAGAAAAFCVLLLLCHPLQAQPVSASAVKAAFVLNFMKFVEWPNTAFTSAQAPMVLCVDAVPSELSDALLGLDGRTAQGRSLSVRRESAPSAERGCNIAFLANAASLSNAMTADATMLTVGDAPGFAESGGMIGLYSENGKIRFEINAGSVKRSKLRVSSQLMKLARIAGSDRQEDAR